MGWESWLAFSVEAAIGTWVAPTYLWEGEGAADSLTLGYNRTEARSSSGYRTVQAASIRNTHQLPGGALPAMPIYMNGSSLWLLNILKNHFVGSVGSTGGSVWTFSPATVQKALSAFYGLSVTKRTGVDGRAETYAGCVIDELTLAGAHGGFVTVAPTLKALLGTHHATAGTGSFSVTTDPYFTAANCTVTWQGEAIYPNAWSVTSRNGIPDRLGVGVQPRYGYSLGEWSGEASITVSRDDNMGTHYLTKYITPSVGTLIVTGTAPTGTIGGGGVQAWSLTAICTPRPFDLPAQTGELMDTVAFDVTAVTIAVKSDASAL